MAYDTFGFLCKRAREYFKKLFGPRMGQLIRRTNTALNNGNAAVLSYAKAVCYNK